ncbi:MAG: cytoplasmic protein [Deltaproteobacteria bacterium]|jgi:hypothetical protein|nr:cytoplasmic protein [Deltaproteobacteria bacterium]
MPKHTHNFVEEYNGLVGFGLNRETDEKTVIYYLQKFSDDTMINGIIGRLADEELEEIFLFINKILKKHLIEEEYHQLFLKD